MSGSLPPFHNIPLWRAQGLIFKAISESDDYWHGVA